MHAEVQPTHEQPAASTGSSCGRSVRYRIQVPGPCPPLPAASRRASSGTRAILARLSAIPHAPFGGGPYPLTSRSPASNDSPTAPRHAASSHYIWPTVTPPFDRRAEVRHRATPPPIYHRYTNWLRLPARNWLWFFARYHIDPETGRTLQKSTGTTKKKDAERNLGEFRADLLNGRMLARRIPPGGLP